MQDEADADAAADAIALWSKPRKRFRRRIYSPMMRAPCDELAKSAKSHHHRDTRTIPRRRRFDTTACCALVRNQRAARPA